MFADRAQAGELLARKLKELGYGGKDTIVLAIPRGGVPVGAVIAKVLNSPLDIVITRKIPSPNQPELALGAVGPGGLRVLDVSLVERVGVSEDYIKVEIGRLGKEIEEREEKFRGKRPPLDVRNKTVLVTDDGIATGATIEVALRYIRNKNPQKLVLATPVASPETLEKLSFLVDDVVVLASPEEFHAVGQFYKKFSQVSDEEVRKILNSKNQKLKIKFK